MNKIFKKRTKTKTKKQVEVITGLLSQDLKK